MPKQNEVVRIFSSYSSADERYRRELEDHLTVLKRAGIIQTWNFRQIEAGSDWRQTIDVNLNEASLILLLVSASFLASDYCWEIEMKRAIERQANGDAVVIPIIIRDCDWHSAPFAHLQGLPDGGKAITRWRPRDRGWANVVTGLRRKAESMRVGHRKDDTISEQMTAADLKPLAPPVTRTANANDAVTESSDARSASVRGIHPQLSAEFERKASGQRAVVAHRYKRYTHFSIRLYILNPPAEAVAASYRLHSTFKPHQVRHVARSEKYDFSEWIETYGDFKIHVTFSNASGIVVGTLSEYLVQALERHYGSDMEPQIAEAIDAVREH